MTGIKPRLAYNSALNMLGMGLPLVAAIFTIPYLIAELGEARFGILTLVWAVVGYFGLFDFGLGRALTLSLTSTLAIDADADIAPLISTATTLLVGLGIVAALLLWFTAEAAAGVLSSVPDPAEVVGALRYMALALPAIVLTSAYRGILEALYRFDLVNFIRLPMGLMTFIGPALVLFLGFDDLALIAAVLAAGRWIALVAHIILCRLQLSPTTSWLRLHTRLVKPLLYSGGWMTVSNIVSPLMGYLDRMLVGAMVSATAVAYLVTPQEIVTKLWILPIALAAVMFPSMAAEFARGEQRARRIFGNGVAALFLLAVVPSALAAIFAFEFLTLWISPSFASESGRLMQLFAIGTFINCLAHVPFTALQSAGRARVTAFVHLAELPLYVVSLVWLIDLYGVTGAAIAWVARLSVDTAVLFVLCFRLNRWTLGRDWMRMAGAGFLITAAAFGVAAIGSLAVRIGASAVLIATISAVAWFWWRRTATRSPLDEGVLT